MHGFLSRIVGKIDRFKKQAQEISEKIKEIRDEFSKSPEDDKKLFKEHLELEELKQLDLSTLKDDDKETKTKRMEEIKN
ncbi:MAG TPA: hypothetical protein DEQ77_10310, partial [Candidatus Omnitrophica bacterium]|nr:hypothetical protein [Candidatus Omnitrophota bacterium]